MSMVVAGVWVPGTSSGGAVLSPSADDASRRCSMLMLATRLWDGMLASPSVTATVSGRPDRASDDMARWVSRRRLLLLTADHTDKAPCSSDRAA